MAFSGVHITCGYAGAADEAGVGIKQRAIWSENPSSGTATTNAAPAVSSFFGYPVFEFYAAADSYVSIGPSPNASASPREIVKAGERLAIYGQPGDKAAWILVP